MNYGTPEDYEQLAKLGVDVKGKIVIARYGRSWRGIKPKVAYEHGAVGCIIYSDPREDGFFPGDVFPAGPYRPEKGAQRGSVMDMPIHPGDPLTPGRRRSRARRGWIARPSQTILKIPVLPISYGDALPLLRNLKGPVAPEAWRGALPITYHVGAGPAKVHLKLAFDWSIRPLYNVIVRIDGSEFPDEWIIHGNHHDAWVNGASDPTSGNVALMETARGLGELLKSGWRPKRTIILGVMGRRGMGTARVDRVGRETRGGALDEGRGLHQQRQHVEGLAGRLGLALAAGLRQRRDAGRRRIRSARTRRSSRRSVDRAVDQAKTADEKGAIQRRKDLPIEALGSGSDYTAFLDHLTIASLNLGFGGEGPDGGVYHSTYDSFYWYTHFSDTDFAYGAALSRTIGTAILRLADADILPFEFTATAATLRGYVNEIDKLRKDIAGAPPLDIDPVLAAVERLAKAADNYDRAVGTAATPRRGARSREAGRAEPAALHLGARVQARGRPAEARVVQASRLRAGFLHRLRRQDAARHPRRHRTEARGTSRGSTSRSSSRPSTSSRRRSTRRRRSSHRADFAATSQDCCAAIIALMRHLPHSLAKQT